MAMAKKHTEKASDMAAFPVMASKATRYSLFDVMCLPIINDVC